MIVSSGQQSDSAIHIHVPTLKFSSHLGCCVILTVTLLSQWFKKNVNLVFGSFCFQKLSLNSRLFSFKRPNILVRHITVFIIYLLHNSVVSCLRGACDPNHISTLHHIKIFAFLKCEWFRVAFFKSFLCPKKLSPFYFRYVIL